MDIVVVGAGLAGLAAAQRLIQAGCAVTIVEARDRIGGRLWTVRDEALSAPVELGPEWIANEGVVHDLLSRHGVRLQEAEGDHWRRAGDRWAKADDMADNTARFLECAAAGHGADRSLADALRDCYAEPSEREARALLLAYVEGFHAADPDRLSIQWLAQVEKTQPADASGLRAPTGADRLIDVLAAGVLGRGTLRLRTVARQIQWRRGGVEVGLDGASRDTLSAQAAIITVPLPMLAAASDDPQALQFSPDLPEKRDAARRLEMGHVVKLVLRFRAPFWTDIGPLRHAAFVHAFEEPFPTWWMPASLDRPLLTAWAGGPKARRFVMLDEAALTDLAVTSLARMLAVPHAQVASQLEACHWHDWSADPFALGAYTYVGVGGADAHRTLARPVDDTLYFAGEATCGAGFNATMEGAVHSGWRAAHEVLRRPDSARQRP